MLYLYLPHLNSVDIEPSFRALCTGEKGVSAVSGKPLYYKNSIVHRSIRDFMIQAGGEYAPASHLLNPDLTNVYA